MGESSLKVHLNVEQTQRVEEASAKVGLNKSQFCRYLIFTHLNKEEAD